MRYDKNFTRLPDQPENRYYKVDGLSPDEPVGHSVLIPEDAFADRMTIYGLTTEQDALNHIMWEHHVRLNPTMTPQAAGIPANVLANFDRIWGPGHKAPRGIPMTAEEVAQQHARMTAIRRPPRRR